MKLNYAYVAGAALIGVGVLVVAYQMGQQGGEPAAESTSVATTASSVASDSAKTGVAGNAGHALTQNARFSHFRVGNRNVKSLYADGKYIWVGTSGGVIRYDTETDDYQLYNNQNSGLLSNGIFHVSKLGARMAVGTYGGGLSLYDPYSDQWEVVNIPQGLADQFVYDVVQDSEGHVWIATWSGANRVRGGNFANPDAWDTYTVENTEGGLPNPWVYSLAPGVNGEMWMATEGGLARFKDGNWTNWQHTDGLGAPYEVVKEAIQFKNDPARASVHHSRQKEEQGLTDVKDAYNPNYVISLAVQKDGTVWSGTWGAGLAKFDGERWTNYTTFEGLPGNHIFMLYVDTSDQLWVGTNKGLAKLKQDGSFDIKTTADGLYAENVFSMANAANGDLWIGSFGGVAHIESAWR